MSILGSPFLLLLRFLRAYNNIWLFFISFRFVSDSSAFAPEQIQKEKWSAK